ncbi:hypothetical protein [Chitinimonas koreensis]|uniref:hypothetical protein n=1 Tax=Chitinimonas koreensis TaxID=356302 RepID=UPI0012FC3727|nr:hypothetical protein [Chitinimonas koreensis]QNM94886.1 hypothetical protein H9L41_13240 [Chitinimonas koreensis]
MAEPSLIPPDLPLWKLLLAALLGGGATKSYDAWRRIRADSRADRRADLVDDGTKALLDELNAEIRRRGEVIVAQAGDIEQLRRLRIDAEQRALDADNSRAGLELKVQRLTTEVAGLRDEVAKFSRSADLLLEVVDHLLHGTPLPEDADTQRLLALLRRRTAEPSQPGIPS